MLAHWIWLATRPGLGDDGKLALLSHFSSIEAIYDAQQSDYVQIKELADKDLRPLLDKSLGRAREILDRCREEDVHILAYTDASYPSRLANIPDPPITLYYKGRLPEFDGEAAIGVVGTRHATDRGALVARRLGYQLAKCGAIVISGLAAGIDTQAMEGALLAGGPVIGVPGGGVDMIYPKSNERLYETVAEKGCLISEYPPGTAPNKWTFPRRNRIISGLSCGIVVVEAPKRSGALITAKFARQQDRPVFAVPGRRDDPACAGSNTLAQTVGAARNIRDILGGLMDRFPGTLSVWDGPMPGDRSFQEPAAEAEKTAPDLPIIPAVEEKSVDNRGASPYSEMYQGMQSLSQDERTVLMHLRQAPIHVDAVIADAGLPPGQVLAALTLLEVKGLVARHPGKYYSLTRQAAGGS